MTKVTSESRRTSSFGSGGGVEYVVKAHDTLEGIAARYDCTPTQLLKMNKMASRLLFPGQKIHVPDARAQQDTSSQHNNVRDTAERHQEPSAEAQSVFSAMPSLVHGHGSGSAGLFDSVAANGANGGTSAAEDVSHSQAKDQPGSTSEAASATVNSGNLDPQLDADCLQRFLKIRCKHFTDNEGVVSGVLLVTPNCVMFDPDVSHPLVIENGADRYGMVVAMDTIVSAALYKDASVLVDEYGGKPTSEGIAAQLAAEKRSSSPGTGRVDEEKSEQTASADSAETEPAPDQSQTSASFSSSQAQPSLSAQVESDQKQEKAGFDSSSPSSTADATVTASTVDAKRAELENELAAMTLTPDLKTVLRRHVSDSGREGEEPTAGADLLVTAPRPQASSCPSELEADLVKESGTGKGGHRLLTADYDQTQSLNPKRASLYTLRHNLRRRANTLGGTLVQGAQAVGSGVGTLGGTLVQGAQAVGGTLTTGAKAVAKMPQNLVNMSSGLFATSSPQQTSSFAGWGGADVLDIQESWFGNDEVGNQTAEQMRKRQQNYALLARLQQKTVEARQHWMNMFACATTKEEHPNLFAPVEDILPYPRQLYSDLCIELPYYLCIRLDEKRRQRKLASRDSKEEYEFGNKTKTEFWFTVPRDKADTLYAFLIQWTPDLSSDEEAAAGAPHSEYEKRYPDESMADASGKNSGFVILDVNDDEAASVHDNYVTQPGSLPASLNLNREWEIVTVEEVKRRLSLMDLLESEPQPLPEGSQLSGLLDDDKVRCLMDVLPARAQGYPWALIYSSETHGFSLRTLYRNMQQWNEEISPTLLAIKDTNGRIFGAVVNCPVRISEHFYGSGESLLFTFHPEFAYFRWTGENNFIVKGNPDSLSFGAGRGVYGLWLDGDLYHGRTQHCQTFDNLPLSEEEDFTIAGVEAWGFTLSAL